MSTDGGSDGPRSSGPAPPAPGEPLRSARTATSAESAPPAQRDGHDSPSPSPARGDTCDDELVRLAAMARVLERISEGDARIAAGEVRRRLERLCCPVAHVVSLEGKRRGRR